MVGLKRRPAPRLVRSASRSRVHSPGDLTPSPQWGTPAPSGGPQPPVGDPSPQWGTPAPRDLTPRPPLHCDGEGEADRREARLGAVGRACGIAVPRGSAKAAGRQRDGCKWAQPWASARDGEEAELKFRVESCCRWGGWWRREAAGYMRGNHGLAGWAGQDGAWRTRVRCRAGWRRGQVGLRPDGRAGRGRWMAPRVRSGRIARWRRLWYAGAAE